MPSLRRWTPESVGDYASGTNHVLPTYGYARMYSGVSLDSFVKKMTVQSLSPDGLRALVRLLHYFISKFGNYAP
jgi:histidinol dehydrogenase